METNPDLSQPSLKPGPPASGPVYRGPRRLGRVPKQGPRRPARALRFAAGSGGLDPAPEGPAGRQQREVGP
jgi:hypothetical protein